MLPVPLAQPQCFFYLTGSMFPCSTWTPSLLSWLVPSKCFGSGFKWLEARLICTEKHMWTEIRMASLAGRSLLRTSLPTIHSKYIDLTGVKRRPDLKWRAHCSSERFVVHFHRSSSHHWSLWGCLPGAGSSLGHPCRLPRCSPRAGGSPPWSSAAPPAGDLNKSNHIVHSHPLDSLIHCLTCNCWVWN